LPRIVVRSFIAVEYSEIEEKVLAVSTRSIETFQLYRRATHLTPKESIQIILGILDFNDAQHFFSLQSLIQKIHVLAAVAQARIALMNISWNDPKWA